MSIYFVDSSALAKRYLTEDGSDWLRAISARSAGHQLFIAQITLVEVISAVSRRKRELAISPRTAGAIRLMLKRHANREYDVIPLTNAVVQRAQTLVGTHPLKAYDAVQLATALETQDRLAKVNQAPPIFVAADTRLLDAASAEGLQTHQPR